LLLLWWLFFSRAPWLDRLGGLVLILGSLAGTWFLRHESMGPNWFIGYAMPLLLVAFVVALVLTRRLAQGARRAAVAVAVLLAGGAWLLVRTDGIDGDHDSIFASRFSATAEQPLREPAPRIAAHDQARPAPVTAESEAAEAAKVAQEAGAAEAGAELGAADGNGDGVGAASADGAGNVDHAGNVDDAQAASETSGLEPASELMQSDLSTGAAEANPPSQDAAIWGGFRGPSRDWPREPSKRAGT